MNAVTSRERSEKLVEDVSMRRVVATLVLDCFETAILKTKTKTLE